MPSVSIEPAMAALTAELDDLTRELAALRHRAEVVERQATRGLHVATPRPDTLLEQVFADTARARRAELDAAMTQARAAADRQITVARRQAQEITRDGGPAWTAPSRSMPTHRPVPGPRPDFDAGAGPRPAELGADSPVRRTPPPPPPSGPGDQFAEFWVGDQGTEPSPRPRFAFLDVVLPVIATGIIFMIVLSWVG